MSSDNKNSWFDIKDSLTTDGPVVQNMETFDSNLIDLNNEEIKSNFFENDSNDKKFNDQKLNDKSVDNEEVVKYDINGTSNDITSDEQLNDNESNHSSDYEDIDDTDEPIKPSLSLSKRTVSVLSDEDFPPLNPPLNPQLNPPLNPLPDTVTELVGINGSKVFLVGTAHFSEKSQLDVSQTIRRVQPNVVVLELCESRLSILSFDEKTIMEESKTMGIAKIRRNIQEYGVVQGVMYILLLSLSAHLTKELGMAPGGEFRRAFIEANRVPGCVVHLGDRPVHVTLRRAISSLGVWQKLRLAFGIIFNNESISKEEVEKCKQKDLLEEMLAEMTGEFPALSRVFVNERDTYLAYSLWLASTPMNDMNHPTGSRPTVVVGVVGIGHVPGIVKQWGKVTDKDIPPLLKIPETSLTTTIIKKSVKYTFLGLAVWGCYRILVPNSLNDALSNASLQTISWIQNKIK